MATLGGGPLCWLANPSQPGTLGGFLARARRRPPPSPMAPRPGTLMHLATEILKREAGGVDINQHPLSRRRARK